MKASNPHHTHPVPSHYCRMCDKTDKDTLFGPNSKTQGGVSFVCQACWANYVPELAPATIRMHEVVARRISYLKTLESHRREKRAKGLCRTMYCIKPHGGWRHKYCCVQHSTLEEENHE